MNTKPIDRLIIALVLGLLIGLICNAAAHAHYRPGSHNVKHAINLAWCGKSNLNCYAGEQAKRVAYCETGGTYDVWARNGQYRGLFQVSAHWRRAVPGFAYNPWAQARHAHRIYRLTGGWSHWACRP